MSRETLGASRPWRPPASEKILAFLLRPKEDIFGGVDRERGDGLRKRRAYGVFAPPSSSSSSSLPSPGWRGGGGEESGAGVGEPRSDPEGLEAALPGSEAEAGEAQGEEPAEDVAAGSAAFWLDERRLLRPSCCSPVVAVAAAVLRRSFRA